MNSPHTARAIYAQPVTAVRCNRSIEYELLARVTQRLARAWETREANFPGLAAALAANTEVWSAFAADVAGPGNGLPAPLRARLFYLYEFTLQHSRKVLSGDAAAGVLVDINTAVMRGLRGDTGAQVAEVRT